MTVSPVYTARASAYGDGRNGRVVTSDDVLDLDLVMPRELGGQGGDLTNPEQLFAAGYAACFHSALKLAARNAGADPTGSVVHSSVGIGPTDTGGFSLVVGLEVEAPAMDRGEAEKVVAAAHEICPYSNATRGNVEVTLSVR